MWWKFWRRNRLDADLLGWRSVEILAQDVRYAARTLRQSPGFAAATILALALGIGVNSAIFTIFDEVAFRPLPIKDGDRIVGIYETFHGQFSRNMHGNIHMLSYPEFLNYQAHNRVFTGLAAYAGLRGITLAGAQPEAISGLLVTGNYFNVLGAGTSIGRTFLGEEFVSRHPVAVISEPFWKRRFASDPGIVGKTLRLNQTLFTIVGVTAPGFVGTEARVPDIWLPLPMQPRMTPDTPAGEPHDYMVPENLSWLSVVGRLKPGVSARQAQADLGFLASQQDTSQPGRITEVSVVPSTFLSNPDARPVVLIGGALLMVAVGLVLLIACANVANLLLARATVRQREIALRLSLGATRARLVRQLLTESMVLALAGGGLGLLLARRLLETGRALTDLPAIDFSPDINVLSYTLLLTVGASLVFGLIPALQATTPNLSGGLKEEGSILGTRIHKSRLRGRLISLQVAICTVLLIGAGLLVRGLMNLNSLDPGFRIKNVFVTSFDLRLQNYDDVRAAAFYRELLSRIDGERGAQSALVAVAPWRGVRRIAVGIEGGPIADQFFETDSNIVTGNYFDVMGIRLAQGRTFTAAEMTRGDPVAIVSQAMVKTWWNGQNPLGQRLRYRSAGAVRSVEIIGVAKDVRSVRVSAQDGPVFYLPANPSQPSPLVVVTRSAASAPLAATIQRIARELDPNVLVSVRTIEDNLDRETEPMRLGSVLALSLGGLALTLASVGIYGVMAYVVSQRTREIGIRMALGAERSTVLRWMLAESMRPVVWGMAIGIVLAAAASVASSKLLLGVSPLDPLAYLVVSMFLASVALLASYIPARRATRVDPMSALRYE